METGGLVPRPQQTSPSSLHLITGDRIPADAEAKDGSIALASGKALPCDLYIPAFVAAPNSGFVGTAYKTKRGAVKVDPATLHVLGHPGNVFALGDVTDQANGGGIPHLEDQRPTVVKNLLASIQGKPLSKYAKSFPMGTVQGPMLVAFGHGLKDGLGLGPNLPGCCTFCCWFCPCFGGPCALPAGPGSAKAKTDFNMGNFPSASHGLGDHVKDKSQDLSVHTLSMQR